MIEDFYNKRKALGKSPNTLLNHEFDINNFFTTLKMDQTELENIRIEDIERYIELMKARKCSGNTVNRRLSTLRMLFKFMIRVRKKDLRRIKNSDVELADTYRMLIEEWEDIIEIENVQAINNEKLPFTIEELNILFNYLQEIGDIQSYLLYRFSAIGTGARDSATRKMRNEDFDCFTCDYECEDCIPTVNVLRKGKKEYDRDEGSRIKVRIEKETCQECKAYISIINNKDGFLFVSKFGVPITNKDNNQQLYEHLKKCGIERKKRSFHSMRHTFITEASRNETSYMHLARQVDQKSKVGITGRYEHLKAEELKINFPRLKEEVKEEMIKEVVEDVMEDMKIKEEEINEVEVKEENINV